MELVQLGAADISSSNENVYFYSRGCAHGRAAQVEAARPGGKNEGPMKQCRRHCRSRLLLKQSLRATPRLSLELTGRMRSGT